MSANVILPDRILAMDARQDQLAKGTESLPNGENRRIYREQRPSSTISGSLSCPNSAANRGFLHFSCARYLEKQTACWSEMDSNPRFRLFSAKTANFVYFPFSAGKPR